MDRKLTFITRIWLILAFLLAALPLNASPAQAEGVPAGLGAAEWNSMQAQMAAASNLPVSQIKKLTASTPLVNSNFGASNGYALQGDVAVLGAGWETVGANTYQGAVYIFYRNFTNGIPDDWSLVKRLTAADGAAYDYYGISVALSGDRLFVGALTGGADDKGSVYIYERNRDASNGWGLLKMVTSGDTLAGRFGFALDAFGDLLLVGANGTDVSGDDNRGAAYLLGRNQGGADSWGVIKKLTASDNAINDNLGWSVALSADIAVLSATLADVNANADQGAVYLFYRNQGGVENWGQFKKITASDGAAGDQFGSTISLDTDTLAVAAAYADISGKVDQGAAYLFARNQGGSSNNWGQVTKIITSDGAANDKLARVALSGDMLAVGAVYADISGKADQGAAYLFARNQGGADAWGQTQKITASDGAANDQFGRLALDGNTLLVTSLYADVSGQADAGAAYIFYLQGTGWTQTAMPQQAVNNDSNQGYSVALDNGFLAVGAPFYDAGATSDIGAVYLYRRNQGGTMDGWQYFKSLAAPSIGVGDRFGHAVSLWDDTLAVSAYNRNSGNGAVFIYLRNQGGTDNWGLLKTLDGVNAQKFGASISLMGDLLAVGAPLTSSNSGEVYLYERNKDGVDNWGLLKTLTAPNAAGQFGFSVALDTGQLVIGAPYALNSGLAYLHLRNEGGVDNWGLYKQLISGTPGSVDDHFGWSVGIQDDTILVGAPDFNISGQVDQGAAFIFVRNQGGLNAWGELALLTDPQGTAGDRFGFSTDLNVDTAIVGNPRASIGGNAVQGSATIFERNTGGLNAWDAVQRLTAANGRADDRFGYAVALQDRFAVVGANTADMLESTVNVGAAYVYQLDQVFSLNLTRAGAGVITSADGKIYCNGTACVVPFSAGASVTLNAIPVLGSTFTGWSGDCTGTGSCTVTMSQVRNVTATFQSLYTLTVTTAGAGTVNLNPPGMNCSISCTQDYLAGTNVTLTPNPAAGSAFAGWSGDCAGTGACTILMSQARNVTATFQLAYTLMAGQNGLGSGLVTSDPAGINCGSDCTEAYIAGTSVTLTAQVAPGSIFTGWSGDCGGTGTCTVTMNQARYVTANFDLATFTLTVGKSGTGSGTVTSSPAGINCGSDCSQDYSAGTSVTLTPNPAAGSAFSGWSGDSCSGTDDCTVTMDQARNVTAMFETSTKRYTLTIVKSGKGTGTVTSLPAGISCGADCSEAYAISTSVKLTLTPSATSATEAFYCSDSTTSTTVTMDTDKTCTVVFTPLVKKTIYSVGTQDGWTLESAENSNLGGSVNSTLTTFRLGDDATKKQYRAILSFNTGTPLPDNAVIKKVTLKIKKQATTGTGDPFSLFQGLMVELKPGNFNFATLEAKDFQAAATKSYGPFKPTPVSNWYSISLNSATVYINKVGNTQIRLRFKIDDNNNAAANYISFYSGNYTTAANRPQLIVEYYVPTMK